KRTMLNHPFIEFIRSLFDCIESNWRYDAVFRLLKTGFIPASDLDYPLDIDAIDELENYVLEYGIRSKTQWFQEEKWIYKRFGGFSKDEKTKKKLQAEKKINRKRKKVVDELQTFDEKIRKQQTVKERLETIYYLPNV